MIYLTSFTLPSQESEENYLNKFYTAVRRNFTIK